MMNALIVYDSQFGNTERIARVIAATLTSPRVMRADDMDPALFATCDLLVVGGPTQKHTASPAMRALIEELPRHSLEDVPAAAFDTRYRMPELLTGSAAAWIAAHLKRAGAKLIAEPESFFVERDEPPDGEKRRHELEQLELGEEERAVAWARQLAGAAIPAT